MSRLRLGAFLGVLTAGCLVLAGSAFGAQNTEDKAEKKADHHEAHVGGSYEKCAKACTHCMRECESCALHCAKLVADGKKAHLRTLGTCLDCSEFCAGAARLASRHGPISTLSCEACAKACDICGKACEKFKEDAHMERCAKACRDCAQACRTMVQEVGHKRHEAGAEKKSE